MNSTKTNGLIAAPFTPMHGDGSIRPDLIPAYADWIKNQQINGVFICGTTGEGMLLTLDERKVIAEQWIKEQSEDFKVFVHVGTTSAMQSKELAEHAQASGAYAIGCMGPVFLRPGRLEELVSYCAEVASGASGLPFYYYHIPSVSGISLSMPGFLREAQKLIPNLAGIKFTDRNMMEMLQCINADGCSWDILHGFDEELLGGLSMGATAAIGSTYNYIPSLYRKIINAFNAGDLQTARHYQLKSTEFVDILIRYGGGVIGGKPVMKMIGLDCGPLRSPARNLSESELLQYEKELNDIGFFNWVKGQV